MRAVHARQTDTSRSPPVVPSWRINGVSGSCYYRAHPTSSKGHKYILTVIDHFSRWAEAYPIRNQESLTVATTLVDQWISSYGCPKQLLTDQGPCFEAALFRDLCRLLQIDRVRTSPYKPSTNGTIERFHRTLNSMLGRVVAQNQK